jgi:type IV pilus assembly protein PilQ
VLRNKRRIFYTLPLVTVAMAMLLSPVLAQGVLDAKVTANYENKSVGEVIADLAKQTSISVTVDPKVVGNINLHLGEVKLSQALDEVCRVTGSFYGEVAEGSFVIASPDPQGPYYAAIARVELVRINHLDSTAVMAALAKHPYAGYMTLSDPKATTLNAVVITAPPPIIERLKADIKKIDLPKAQIEIQVGVLDTSGVQLRDMGTTWEYSRGNKDPNGLWTIQLADNVLGFQDTRHGKILLSLLDRYSKDQLKILAQPRLVARDNEPAKLFFGKRNYFLNYWIGLGGATTTPFLTTPVESGVRLTITAKELENQEILVTFDAEVSEIVGTGVTGLPVINTRQINSTLKVKSGETIISGGLVTKLEYWNRVHKLPEALWGIVHYIPIVRDLFVERHREVRDQEITILITPRIILPPAPEVKEEVKKAKEVVEERKPPLVVPAAESPPQEETKETPPAPKAETPKGKASGAAPRAH